VHAPLVRRRHMWRRPAGTCAGRRRRARTPAL